MLSPAAMRKVRIFVLERDVEKLTRRLGELGVLHLRSSVEASEGLLEPEDVGEGLERCEDLIDRLKELMEQLDVETGELEPPSPGQAPSLDQVEELVETVEGKASSHIEEVEEVEEALEDSRETLGELAPFKDFTGPLRPLLKSPFLEVRAGQIPAPELAALEGELPRGVLTLSLSEQPEGEDRARILVVGGRRSRFAMDTVLDDRGFRQEEIPTGERRTPAQLYREAEATKQTLQARLAQLREELRRIARPYRDALRDALAAVTVQRRLYGAEQQFGSTWTTAVVYGWVPARKAGELRTAIHELVGDHAAVEVQQPTPEEIEAGKVPSFVVHSRFLEPFERLVRGYGLASYTELEPTLMFAAAFLLMFGFIFGDLGHGLCLVGIGLLLFYRKSARPQIRDIGYVIAAAGVAAATFGTFLQGSFFGRSLREMGFRLTLGFEPIRLEGPGAGAGGHVVRYILLSLGLGVVLISLGVVLNVVNKLRRGDWSGIFVDRFGVPGMVFYWGGLAVGAKMALAGHSPADWWLLGVMVGLPVVLLVLGNPLASLLRAGAGPSEPGGGVRFFEGAMEALEMIMLYVANTFSFLRVAAFALSHAALSYIVFVLQDIVSGLPGAVLWSPIVFIAGTAIILALEGLIVAIQILRLEYYEFFTKFFSAEGTRYEPFRLGEDTA